MNEDNKKRLIKGAKVAGLAIGALMTIATVSAVLNFCPVVAGKVVAVLTGLANAFAIYKAAKRLKA